MKSPKSGSFLIVIDDRLPRERAVALRRTIDWLGKSYVIRTARSRDITDESLLEIIEEHECNAVIVPWYQYLACQRVETRLSATRRRERIFAGYFADSVRPHDLDDLSGARNRVTFLDWTHLVPSEIGLILRGIARETERARGIEAWINPNTTVYGESWGDRNGMGFRFDQIGTTLANAGPEAQKRVLAARLVLTGLWGLVYEEGAGRSDLSNAIHPHFSNAEFQFAADEGGVFFELRTPLRSWTPAEVVREFWPNVKGGSTSAQLLLRHADFVRVFLYPESQMAEISVALLPSASAEAHPNLIHSLWVDSLPGALPGTRNGKLEPLPAVPTVDSGHVERLNARIHTLEDLLMKAGGKIHSLKRSVVEKESLVGELRSGGLGSSRRMELPDAEDLLVAFGERLEAARRQLDELHGRLMRLERDGATPSEITAVQRQIEALARKQQDWLKRLAETLKAYRPSRAG